MILPVKRIRTRRTIKAATRATLTVSVAGSGLFSYQGHRPRMATHHLTNLATMRTAHAKTLARAQRNGKESESVMIPLRKRSGLGLLPRAKPSRARSVARRKKSASKSDAKNASNAENLDRSNR
jgi:hypothetical protein